MLRGSIRDSSSFLLLRPPPRVSRAWTPARTPHWTLPGRYLDTFLDIRLDTVG